MLLILLGFTMILRLLLKFTTALKARWDAVKKSLDADVNLVNLKLIRRIKARVSAKLKTAQPVRNDSIIDLVQGL